MKTKAWELKDIIMMAILGVVFSAVYLAVFDGGMVLSTLLAPSGLSNFAFEIIYGVWFMAATLAAYIIRKPGVALATEVLASAIELLMGNSGGLTVVLTGVIQGAGAEVIFALFRYKKWDLISMSLAGMLSAVFIFVYELFYLNYIALAAIRADRAAGRSVCQRHRIFRRHLQAGRRRTGEDRRGEKLCHWRKSRHRKSL